MSTHPMSHIGDRLVFVCLRHDFGPQADGERMAVPRKGTDMIVFLKNVLCVLGVAAGSVLLLGLVAANVYIFYMMIESVVRVMREERGHNRTN